MANRRTVSILAVSAGLVAAAVALASPSPPPRPAPLPEPAAAAAPVPVATPAPAPAPVPVAAPTPAPMVPPSDCRGAADAAAKASPGNPAARRAAQRGLGFLAREAV